MTTCNIAGAARLLKVHEETVAEMIRECKIPAAKVGRAWVMLERDVLDYIEQQIRRQTAERLGRSSAENGRRPLRRLDGGAADRQVARAKASRPKM